MKLPSLAKEIYRRSFERLWLLLDQVKVVKSGEHYIWQVDFICKYSIVHSPRGFSGLGQFATPLRGLLAGLLIGQSTIS